MIKSKRFNSMIDKYLFNLKVFAISVLIFYFIFPHSSYSQVPCLSENIYTESSCVEMGFKLRTTNIFMRDIISFGFKGLQIGFRHTELALQSDPLEEFFRIKLAFPFRSFLQLESEFLNNFHLAFYGTPYGVFREYYAIGGVAGYEFGKLFFEGGFVWQYSHCRECGEPEYRSSEKVNKARYKGYIAGRYSFFNKGGRIMQLVCEFMIGDYKGYEYEKFTRVEKLGYYFALAYRIVLEWRGIVYPVFSTGFAIGNDPLKVRDRWPVPPYKDYPPLFFVNIGLVVNPSGKP